MSLEPAAEPNRLYIAVGTDVNGARPLFTGDVVDDVELPGLGRSAVMVIGHPCSIRGARGALAERIPVAAVRSHHKVSSEEWRSGFFNRFPLPGLPLEGDFHVAFLDQFGLADTGEVNRATRVACLSHLGINLLQQRLVFHQTRLEVEAELFQRAFDHTYEEADLLESWVSDLDGIVLDSVAAFETWIREGDPSRQERLKTHSERASIRREMREEIRSRQGGGG